jgi:2,4-dienoyl-CoA reductase-like NADH-dependent reductase (Old Yellow Enzyme family)
VGGAGLVIVEASAVEARGRISPWDLGIWNDLHTEALKPIARFVKEQGAVAGIQLAHAGRKGSTYAPWLRQKQQVPQGEGGWENIAPSAIPFEEFHHPPAAMTEDDIKNVIEAFTRATKRAMQAGFELIEIHGAHGYLIHQFLSPLSNHRSDRYGGSLENRMRFATEVVAAVRSEWPSDLPLFLRLSASDWFEGGWSVEDSVTLARTVKPLAIDLVDCSS